MLVTGFYGDTVWNRVIEAGEPDAELKWPSPSGISASEGRLATGFINLALPFLFGRSRASIAQISTSPEMEKWSVGGAYDRPIPRRILEEAGVPRSAFGLRKKAIVNSASSPINPQAREQYYQWLGEHAGVDPKTYRLSETLARLSFGAIGGMQMAAQRLGWKGARKPPEDLWPPDRQPRVLMFRWAVDTLAGRYEKHE